MRIWEEPTSSELQRGEMELGVATMNDGRRTLKKVGVVEMVVGIIDAASFVR